ncbi:hypothetical protein ACOSP7_021901 [Xanthoceras sorbifolium]
MFPLLVFLEACFLFLTTWLNAIQECCILTAYADWGFGFSHLSDRGCHRSINSNDVLKLAAGKDDVKDEIVMLSVGLIAGGSLPLRLPMKQNSSRQTNGPS